MFIGRRLQEPFRKGEGRVHICYEALRPACGLRLGARAATRRLVPAHAPDDGTRFVAHAGRLVDDWAKHTVDAFHSQFVQAPGVPGRGRKRGYQTP